MISLGLNMGVGDGGGGGFGGVMTAMMTKHNSDSNGV